MLSRGSALGIATAYREVFTPGTGFYNPVRFGRYSLHDFLFERDYPAWVYDKAKNLFEPREAQDWIMHLQTGRSVKLALPDATDEEREQVGRQVLHRLAQDILNLYNGGSLDPGLQHHFARRFNELLCRLKFDGYTYKFPHLLAPESDILDTREEAGVLETLYTELKLAKWEVAGHCLKQSEEHWRAGKWDDCISNARRFLECVLQEVAAAHSLHAKGTALPAKTYERPVEVRDHLEREGLLEAKEKKALAEVYGLLSNTGSHPYIAQQDQARLLRQQALILSQFVMLRYQGYLAANP